MTTNDITNVSAIKMAIYDFIGKSYGESEVDNPSWNVRELAKSIEKTLLAEGKISNEKLTYNGWTNYATWRVMLELMSEYIDHEIERIREGDTELLDMSDNDLAEYLKEYAAEQVESTIGDSAGLMANIVEGWANAFLKDVDWLEVAQSAKETWNTEKELAQ